LRVGINAIALAARQSSVDQPPKVAVDGAYTLADGEHPLGSDSKWRCSQVFERQAHWWFESEFHDEYWPTPLKSSGIARGKVRQPPRSVTTPDRGQSVTQ
jgi:hypothetical protein